MQGSGLRLQGSGLRGQGWSCQSIRGRLVLKAHRLLYHSTLGTRAFQELIERNEEERRPVNTRLRVQGAGCRVQGAGCRVQG